MSPVQGSLFDPAMLTDDGMPRDCPVCKGTGWRPIGYPAPHNVADVVTRCKNCAGTGRAVVPY